MIPEVVVVENVTEKPPRSILKRIRETQQLETTIISDVQENKSLSNPTSSSSLSPPNTLPVKAADNLNIPKIPFSSD